MNKILSTILVALLLLAIVPAAHAQGETGAIAVPRWNINAYSTDDGAYENILVVLEEGARYPILGRNFDDSWYLIDYGAGQGWVRGVEIILTGADISTVPVTSAAGAAVAGPAAVTLPASGFTAIPTVSLLNVRATPSTSADLISRVTSGSSYPVLGRNEGATWLLINHGEGQGWVFGIYVRVSGGDVEALPVTDAAGNLVGAPASTAATTATVAVSAPATSGLTARPNAWLLNVRQRPSTSAAVLGSLEWGYSYPVVGRNADTSWLLVDDDEARGWVSAKFVNVSGGDINSAVVTDVEGTPGARTAVVATTATTTTTTTTATVAATAPVSSSSTVFAIALWDLNVRASATTLSEALALIKANSRYPLIGKLADGSWWLIDYGAGQGWISSGYARYEFEGGGMDFEDVPIIE